MSKENRKRMYDQLVAEDKLYQDDGALIKEFGDPKLGKVDINYSAFNKKQLIKACEEQKIEVPEKATKDDLIVLLENKSDGV